MAANRNAKTFSFFAISKIRNPAAPNQNRYRENTTKKSLWFSDEKRFRTFTFSKEKRETDFTRTN